VSTNTPSRRLKVTDNQILQLFREADAPVLTAGDLAEQLPVTKAAVNKRLRQLVDEQELNRKKVGGAAVVYWLPEEKRSATP